MGEPGKNLSVADVIVLSGWDPYMLLVWNGNSWTIDKVLPERQARAEYARHCAVMPNCPAKLVKMEVTEEHAG